MALKVKAKEREMKVGKNPGVYRYVMLPELYLTLDQDKVISEAAIRSGVTEGVMRACWEGAGKVIKAWATEGHSVALPGLGTMRFGLRAKAVEDPEAEQGSGNGGNTSGGNTNGGSTGGNTNGGNNGGGGDGGDDLDKD